MPPTMSLYAELKRRNVIRVAGLYLVGAWLLVQVAETVLPAFAVPDWGLRALIIVLVLGFVPALVLAWIFQLTPEGIARDDDAHAPARDAAVAGRRMDAVIAIGLAAVVALMVGERLWPRPHAVPAAPVAESPTPAPPRQAEAGAKSVAVLPFADLSPSKDQGYLADGLAEELLNALTRIDGLKVASRTTSFSFRDSTESLPEIARRMKVGHVIEGSVRSAGDRLRVTAQLIDVASDTHLWSETYDRAAGDIFAIQSDIATSIAAALGKRLGGAEVAPAGTSNTGAYDEYLQGLFHMNQRTPAGLRRAIELFGHAVAKDPRFARAHAGLAAAWSLLPGYAADVPRENAFRQASDAARRALEIDPELPEGITVLSQVLRLNGEIDWRESERLFLKAIAIAPNYPTAHHWYGMMLGPAGRRSEAIQELRKAHALDPYSLPIETALAWYLSDAGLHEEAISHIRAVLERQPGFRIGNASGVTIHVHAGDFENAGRLLRQYLAIVELDQDLATEILRGLQAPGNAAARNAAIVAAKTLAEAETSSMTGRSMLALLGADEILLDLLEAGADRASSVEYLATMWQFQRLRGNPRFDALLAAHKLPLDVYRNQGR